MYVLQENWDEFWCLVNGESYQRLAVINHKRCCLKDTFVLLEVPSVKFVRSIDITGCVSLDPTSLIDVSNLFDSVHYFIYRNCPQFSEYHLQRFVDLNRSLIYIDGTGASSVSSTMAVGILHALPNLNKFSVMTRETEVAEWQFIVFQYSRVTFGSCVHDGLPYNGNLSRLTQEATALISEL